MKKTPRGYERIISTLKHYTFPPVVIIETINKCNLNCIMCPQSELTRAVGTMPEVLFHKIIDDVAVHSPAQTQLWLAIMGEVLLLKSKAVEFIQYAVDSGIEQVNLNTNLVPANEQLCEDLVKTQLSRIIIGLDAGTRETYDKVRCGGDFDKVMKNIKTLVRVKKENGLSKPEIIPQFIVLEENKHDLEAFKTNFMDMDVTLKIRQRLGWGDWVESPDLTMGQGEREYPCPWLNRTMSIHVTGQVAQCDAAWDGKYYFGDLNFQTIAQVWNGQLANLREKHWQGNFDYEPCRSCNDWQCGLSEIIDNKEL